MDPRQAEFIEIYRGYTANRLGATVLGGAINFISPTGTTAPGVTFDIEGGSFGQITTSAGAGVREGNFDGYGQVSYTQRDGFRDYNVSDRVDVNLNAGAKLSDIVSSRLFVGYTDLGFQIPGPLPWDKLKQNPKQIYTGPTITLPGPTISNPGPNVVRDQPRRDAEQFRIGSRTSATFEEHLFEYEIGYSYTDDTFRFPIANGIRATDGGDLTNVIRYSYIQDEWRPLPLFEATAMYVNGSADRDFHQNLSGAQGLQFGDNDLTASTLSLQAGFNIPFAGQLTLSPSIAYSYATRENEDNFGQGFRPVAGYNPVTGALQTGFALPQDTSYSRTYSGWNPSLALTFDVDDENLIFGAISRSFEPPTHDDLLATINGNPFFSPGAPANGIPQFAFATPDLEAQKATTIEGGWRGRHDQVSWDTVIYYSWIKDELLSLRDSSGTRLASQNADRTTHFGVELGLGARITDDLSARLAYTYQEFLFDNDPTFGNNRLAGAPRHVVNASLRYAITPEWAVEGEINWWPDHIPVDNANSLFSEPWVTVDFRTSYEINEHFSVFGEVRNVFDEVYASSMLITDTAQPGQAAFLPGDGRAFIVGLKARM
jgi:iron complex outermembrane receptor protein